MRKGICAIGSIKLALSEGKEYLFRKEYIDVLTENFEITGDEYVEVINDKNETVSVLKSRFLVS